MRQKTLDPMFYAVLALATADAVRALPGDDSEVPEVLGCQCYFEN